MITSWDLFLHNLGIKVLSFIKTIFHVCKDPGVYILASYSYCDFLLLWGLVATWKFLFPPLLQGNDVSSVLFNTALFLSPVMIRELLGEE